jgi:cell wall-associated NlpC family hydrolase
MGLRDLHRRTVRQMAFTAAGVLIGVAGTAVGAVREPAPTESVAVAAPVTEAQPVTGSFDYRRLADPPRTVVTDDTGRVVATLTDAARTVNLLGPTRRFGEPAGAATEVTSQTWVRMLPGPWSAGAERQPWFRPWLDAALRDRGPDVLAVAAQHLPGGSDDARFGVFDTDGDGRGDHSDFYDYLGRPWTYEDGRVEQPDPAQGGSVDASGFVRLVFGYRSGVPVRTDGDEQKAAIPRSTDDIAAAGPGVVIVPDRQSRVTEFGAIQAGDLVFFDTDPDRRADLVGICMGRDEAGHLRFIASRRAADGPTMGDTGGASILDGKGEYPSAFRSVKRL